MAEDEGTRLKRTLGFWALASYGLGDILGAGIYALMGKVAGAAGHQAWLAFAVSLVAAAITALSYSELVTRFPRRGGESFYCQQGFRRPLIAAVVGWLVFCAGTLSLSAIAVAFSGYLHAWAPDVPDAVVITAFIAGLGVINFRGIRQSSVTNIICTIIEAGGLVLVIIVGGQYLLGTPAPEPATSAAGPAADSAESGWIGVMQGAALAFFAFIGFQDMVNVAEEVKSPERHFPRAILTALTVAGLTYVVIAMIATRVMSPAALGESSEPLTDVVRAAGGDTVAAMFPFIALFAVANTGLLNFVMASRLLYGMGRERLVPAALARVHQRRRTPHLAILAVLAAALALALSGTLKYLAGATSTLLLVVFLAVNLALVMLKRRESRGHREATGRQRGFRVPVAVPLTGVAVTAVVTAFAEPAVLATTAALIAVGAGLHGLRQATARN
jgi:amino acid transporter